MRILDDSSGLLTFWIVALIVSLECRAVRYQVHRLEEDAGVLDVRCGRRREYTCERLDRRRRSRFKASTDPSVAIALAHVKLFVSYTSKFIRRHRD